MCIICRITRYLEPLAIAANITQASFCRLDQVLLTFGFLVMRYKDEKMNQDEIGRSAIIKSLETRWSKCDQEVFVAAVIVNPFYQTLPFNVNDGELSLWLTRAELRALFSRLFRRFFQREPPPEFFTDMVDFLSSTGKFRRLREQVTFDLEQASQRVRFAYIKHPSLFLIYLTERAGGSPGYSVIILDPRTT